jgi:predicted Zn-dependent protease
MRFFSWFAAVLFLATASAQERQSGQGANFYSREKEIALGHQLAKEFRSHTTPFENVDVSTYVRDTAARLAPQFPGGWPYQVEVVRENTGGALHEPATFPGGPVFVSVELLAEARSEAEFVGMLAHAMAHIASRQGTRELTRGAMAQIGQAPMVWIGGDSSVVPIGMRAFQRANESRCDDWAVKALAAAGYDPAGLASYLKGVQPAATADQLDSTLPDRDLRIIAILAAIAKLPPRTHAAEGPEFARVHALVQVPPRPAPSLIRK